MSSELQLDVRHLDRLRRHLVNTYEIKAGMVFIAGITVWYVPERFKVVCIPCKALYKCSALMKLHKNSPVLYTFTRRDKYQRNGTYPVSLNCDSALLIKTFSWRVSSCRTCCWKVVPSASITTLSGMSQASSSARICCCCSSWRWRRGVVVCDTCTTSESWLSDRRRESSESERSRRPAITKPTSHY